MNIIQADISWWEAESLIERDYRYLAVHHSAREILFREYIKVSCLLVGWFILCISCF